MALLMLMCCAAYQGSAQAATVWEAVSASEVSVQMANPVRNRRDTFATVAITASNIGGAALTGPFRLVIGDLKPADKVSVGNATGKTTTGEPYFDLGASLAAGAKSTVSVLVNGGGPNLFSLAPRVERQRTLPLAVKITAPATLITVGSSPLTVTGTLNDPSAQLTLNGVPVPANNGAFSAQVGLEEGHNVVVARAVDATGQEATASISVSLDKTPPYVTIESVADGATVWTGTLDIAGQVNDIVRGTVAANQANVVVNGRTAAVSNRSYSAQAVPLQEGENLIQVDAADAVGNVGHAQIKVIYQRPAAKRIELVSGDHQTASIRAAVAAPLKAKLLNEQGQPVPNQNVVFRVIQGDGVVGVGGADAGPATLVKTDANGVASTPFKLGGRAGSGNHRVRAAAVGFDGEALFSASATTASGDKVSVNSGNNQRGGVGQPLPLPLVVAVTDAGSNVVQGAAIEFKVVQGGGRFDNGQAAYTAVTDSDGRASAELTLGPEEGLDAQRVTATLAGTAFYAGFTASGLKSGNPGNTSLTGVVLDNQDRPLPGVTVRVDGTTRQAQTDGQGHFRIANAPIGPVRLMVDGSTTTVPGEWPTLPFNLVTIPGAENPLAGPVHLVKLDTEHAQTVGDQDVTLTLPEVPGFALEVKAGSVTFPDGQKTGKLSVTPVNADKIPMPPPNGMQPQFIVTIQPVGTRFDPPARLTLPNVDGHPPGAEVELYSFDHDLEEFVAIGLGTVSADGSVIRSNPGTGVVKAGWHCGSQPGGSGCGFNCAVCNDCDGACNCVAALDDPRVSECKKCAPLPGTEMGYEAPDDTKTPKDKPCKKCKEDGSLENLPDSPPIKTPAPSKGPDPVYVDYVDEGDDWGVFNHPGEYNFDVKCKAICKDGEQKFGLDGDIKPAAGWSMLISEMIPGFPDSLDPECHIPRPRSNDNMNRTLTHERIHSDDFINVINKYKVRIGTAYSSQAECESAKNQLEAEFDEEYFNTKSLTHNHETPGFSNMPKYSKVCVGGIMKEEESGLTY